MTDDERIERVEINLVTPARWRAKVFFPAGPFNCAIVLAFASTTLAIGAEVFGGGGKARGFGIFLGPLWIGFAFLRIRAIAKAALEEG